MESPLTPKRRGPLVLLEGANAASGLGNGLVMVVIPWLVLEQSDSATAAGVVAALSTFFAIFVIPLVGVAVDRFGRRLVSVIADIASGVSVLAFPLMAATDTLSLPLITLVAVVGALIDPAGYTARKALIEDTAHAARIRVESLNGIHEAIFALGWTAGPALGAVLIATIGTTNAFWVAAVLFVAAAVFVAVMRIPSKAAPEAGEEPLGGWRGLLLGITTVWSDRVLRTITIAVMVLAGVYLPTESVVLPVHFESLNTPQSLGLVISALAGGSVIGSLLYGPLSARVERSTIARIALIGTAIGIVPMALLPGLPIMVTFAFILGLSWGPMQPLLNTLVQVRVPNDVQGRVFAVQLSAFYVFPPIAMLLVGVGTDQLGVEPVYLALAALLVVTSLITVFLRVMPQLNESPRPE